MRTQHALFLILLAACLLREGRSFSVVARRTTVAMRLSNPFRLVQSRLSPTTRCSATLSRPKTSQQPALSEPHNPTDPKPHDHMTVIDQLVIMLMTASCALALGGLLRVSGAGAWRYYLAGGICAATSHAITTPIDVVKTRKQVDPCLTPMSFPEATVWIVRNEGARSLLAGLGPTTFGYLLEGAVKFGIYEVLKPAVRTFLATASQVSRMAWLDSHLLGFVLCGSVSGIAASLMLCPMEALRIRLVAEPDFARGWIDGGYKMLRAEGVDGLWKGLTPMLYKQVPYTVTKNVSFDFFTKAAYAILRGAGYATTASTKLAIPLLSAFVASMLSCISSQPGDMLLSLVNAHEGNKRTNTFLKEIWRSEEGIKGLLVGMKARFLHVGIIVTVQLMIYDFVKRLCGVAATGSV